MIVPPHQSFPEPPKPLTKEIYWKLQQDAWYIPGVVEALGSSQSASGELHARHAILLPVVVVTNLLISNCDKLQFGKFMERDQLCEKAN